MLTSTTAQILAIADNGVTDMAKLVREPVYKTIFKMALPMLAGTFALNAYNLTDTWFVSRLGTQALAAMSFTFPVVLFLRFVMNGLGMGTMALIAHALGGQDKDTAARLTTHGIFLTILFSLFITIGGIATITPLFEALGAAGKILHLTEQFMQIWYCGVPVMFVQLLLGSVIMGSGNTKAASFLMVSGTLINCVLDPIMIYGFLSFPSMGLRGAALATVLSQGFVLVAALYLAHVRYRLISFHPHSMREITASWNRILHIGIPSILSSILTPISSAVIIAIVAWFGNSAVAACGVASRIEMFAFMIPMTVGMSLVPFVAQNYGAERIDRIRTARKGTMIFAIVFGLLAAGLFFLSVRSMAGLFSDEPEVIEILVKYVFTTCIGYGFLEVHRYAGFFLTGIHQPMPSAILNIIRVLFFLIPLSLLGAKFYGLTGLFLGRLITDISCGIIGIIWTGKVLRKME